MLMVFSFHSAVVAAEVIVMPRSLSWAIQSITAVPSSTPPILYIRPAIYKTRSVTVVLPASTCAIKPIFLILANLDLVETI